MRLIDADALDWERIEHEHGARHEAVVDCEQMVEKAPTIDAVPLDQCKDCRWYVRSMIKQDGTLDKRYKPDWCDLYRRVREETYFCADGERKDDE